MLVCVKMQVHRLRIRVRLIIELKEWYLISSGVVNYEIGKTSDEERMCRLESMVSWAYEFTFVDQDSYEEMK
ncbi:MAG: hypothetical protein B6I31_04705 [Desulfobacteraceae bacterium 4572_19]|nr:MAG: hypothetical protein B6I31_04705 [Desulfobacteraceae bacterium 4572_19]